MYYTQVGKVSMDSQQAQQVKHSMQSTESTITRVSHVCHVTTLCGEEDEGDAVAEELEQGHGAVPSSEHQYCAHRSIDFQRPGQPLPSTAVSAPPDLPAAARVLAGDGIRNHQHHLVPKQTDDDSRNI